MNLEEMEPAKKPAAKKDLTVMSIDELRDYIATLQDEIERADSFTSKVATGSCTA